MKMHIARDRSALLRHSVAIALVVVLADGCTTVDRLREAQDAFNQGAAAENAQRLVPGNAADTLTSLTSVRTSYATALQSLEKLSDDEKKSLRDDGLWGAALTLKALCQWRLGEYDKALATAVEARKDTPEQIYPRDQALLLALPGLIKTDQAYAKILDKQSFPAIKELLVGDAGAVSDIRKARAAVGDKHPVQIYLIQAQLAAYRNYMVAVDELQQKATVPAGDPARLAAQDNLRQLNDVLRELSTDDAQRKALVQYWAKLCALAVPA